MELGKRLKLLPTRSEFDRVQSTYRCMDSLMKLEKILSAIRSGEVADFHLIPNSIALTLSHSRGPKPNGSLTSIQCTLKDSVAKPTTQQPLVIFLIDQSGSMQGTNYQAAMKVFQAVYDALSDTTLVSIILFNNETQTFALPLSAGNTATQARKSEILKTHLIHQLSVKIPKGGTDIIGALKETAALMMQPGDVKPTASQIDNTSIIFITDGEDNGFVKYTGTVCQHQTKPLPKPSPELLLSTLKMEMEKNYGTRHFPRIMPIGIGISYDEQLLIRLGEEPDFHRTGFLHIANPRDVLGQRTALAATIDPVRVKTQLFITYKDGTHERYPEIYLQKGAEATKEYILDSSLIDQIYLVQEPDPNTADITRIVGEVPAPERLAYQDALLKRFLIAENAALFNANIKCTDRTQFPMFMDKIRGLLQTYPKDYWGKDELCLEAIENLSSLYITMSDAVQNRPRACIISALETHSLFRHERGDPRDLLLHGASSASRTASSCMTPGTLDSFLTRYR